MATEPEIEKESLHGTSDEMGSPETESLPTPKSDLPLKKQSNTRRWLFTLLAVVVVAAIIAVIYYAITASRHDDETQKAAESTTPTHFDSSKALVDKATQNLEGSLINATTINGLGGSTADGYMAYSTPRYRVVNYKFDVLPLESTGAGYKANSIVAEANYKKLASFFETNKFKKVASEDSIEAPINWNHETAEYVTLTRYEADNILCVIWHADASGTTLGDHVTSIGCGDKSSYEAAAKFIDPLFTAYTKVKKPSDQILLGIEDAADNKDGTQNVTLYQEDPNSSEESFFLGRYTKKSGESAWTYLK